MSKFTADEARRHETARRIALQAAAKLDGEARTFRLVANTGDPMQLDGFDMPVVIDLASIDLSGLPVPALFNHSTNPSHIVGVVDTARVVNGELVAMGRFTPSDDPDDKTAMVIDKADAGHDWQSSVGGTPRTVEKVPAGKSVVVNGRTYQGPVCVARELILREISFVALGGDRHTSAVVAMDGSVGTIAARLSARRTGDAYLIVDEDAAVLALVAEAAGEDTPKPIDNNTLSRLNARGLVCWYDPCLRPTLTNDGWERAGDLIRAATLSDEEEDYGDEMPPTNAEAEPPELTDEEPDDALSALPSFAAYVIEQSEAGEDVSMPETLDRLLGQFLRQHLTFSE